MSLSRALDYVYLHGDEIESGEGAGSLGSSRNNVGRLKMMCRYGKTLPVTDS